MEKGKKFISPGAWFSMVYPETWSEFEGGEGAFLFYNPSEWTGNFRISAYKGNPEYGKESIRQELDENPLSKHVKVGRMACDYSQETFEEDGTCYTSHIWITGIGNKLVFQSFFCSDECNFRVFIMILDGIGDGNGRIDMPSRTAAGEKNFHVRGILSVNGLLSFLRRSPEENREIDRIMPISASCMTSAVPP